MRRWLVVDKPLLLARAKTVADLCEITVDEAFDAWQRENSCRITRFLLKFLFLTC
jgi:hypothetical protein